MNHMPQNLALLRELLTLGQMLYCWVFDNRLDLVSSNCPDELFLSLIMLLDIDKETLLQELNEAPGATVFRTSLGLMWVIDIELDEKGSTHQIHAIGPAFFDDISTKLIESNLDRLHLSLSRKETFLKILRNIPVISYTRFAEYAPMLHYCLTEKKIPLNQVRFITSEKKSRIRPEQDAQKLSQHGTYYAECRMLQMIEDGNLDYWAHSQSLRQMGTAGDLGNGSGLRNYKNLTIIFTALVSRAAIRGGLSEETAFTLSDRYISLIESAQTVEEIAHTNKSMQEDYIARVHECKTASGFSSQIRACRDYIHLHLSEKITAKQLAAMVGYAPEYLAKLFKKEMGMGIVEYINTQRIEQAKIMLQSPLPPIAEVGEALGYNSQSYFGAQFLKVTGLSPAAYRKQHQSAQVK